MYLVRLYIKQLLENLCQRSGVCHKKIRRLCMESSKQHCINFTQYIKQKKREGLQQQLRTIPKENIKMLKENPE